MVSLVNMRVSSILDGLVKDGKPIIIWQFFTFLVKKNYFYVQSYSNIFFIGDKKLRLSYGIKTFGETTPFTFLSLLLLIRSSLLNQLVWRWSRRWFDLSLLTSKHLIPPGSLPFSFLNPMPKITFLESPKKGFTKNKVKPFLSNFWHCV